MAGDGDWLSDARTVRWLQRVLADQGAGQGAPTPESREEMVRVLMTTRERLRRRLLVAEGVDPRTGRPVA